MKNAAPPPLDLSLGSFPPFFEKIFKKISAMTSSVLSIWYPIYRELDRPNSFSKLSTLNSF